MAALIDYLKEAVQLEASDIFIVAGGHVSVKLDTGMRWISEEKVMPKDTEELITEMYEFAGRDMGDYIRTGDDDFSFSIPGLSRFRVNTYKQRGSMASVIRVVAFDIPDYKACRIPEEVMKLSELTHGIVIFTGTAGSGKSTTQACIIDRINENESYHIITLENPIEHLHRNKKSIVSQREIEIDTHDYLSALRACLRQAPNVIQLGEMRDLETAKTAMTAAETGHLIFATLHTKGAVNAIDRIIDEFPPTQQEQIRIQLASVLQTVVSQQLIPSVSGDLVPAFEIMHVNGAIKNMIRDNKGHQINVAISTGAQEGMISMDQSIAALYKEGLITKETALEYADNPVQLERIL